MTAMPKFSFKIASPRSLDCDKVSRDKADRLLALEPSFSRCIGCGSCSAVCPAGELSGFDIRKVHSFFSRGRYDLLEDELKKCMLCGKCTLVCPRGVNTRSLIINMRRILNER